MNLPCLLHAFAARASLERGRSGGTSLTSTNLRRGATGLAGLLYLRISGAVAALLVLISVGMPAQTATHCQGPAALEKAIADHPSAAAYDALGAHFASKSEFACAISAFRNAVRLDPSSWQGHYNLGVALLTSGESQKAVDELKAALKLSPGSEQILLPLGVALSNLNRQDEAIDAFRAILRQDPRSVRALDGLTKALIEQKRYTAVIAALKVAPDDEVLRLNLAIAYSKNGNLDDAINVLSAIAKDHPDYAQAHFNLGIVYTQQN